MYYIPVIAIPYELTKYIFGQNGLIEETSFCVCSLFKPFATIGVNGTLEPSIIQNACDRIVQVYINVINNNPSYLKEDLNQKECYRQINRYLKRMPQDQQNAVFCYMVQFDEKNKGSQITKV